MKKLTLLLLLLFISIICYAGTGGTKIIKEDGSGDYTSLVSWEAGEQGVLITTAVASIQGSWTNPDTGGVTIAGWTTYSTAPVLIQAIGSSRATGIWSNTAYRKVFEGSSGACFNIQCQHCWIDGLQVERNASTDNQGIRADSTPANDEIKISNCIVRNLYKPTNVCAGILLASNTSAKLTVWNNIVYGCGTGINLTFTNSLTTATSYNNTVSSCSVGGLWNTTGWTYTSRINMKNNIVQNCKVDYGSDPFVGFSAVLSTNTNISSDATSPNPAYQSKTVSFLDNSTFYYLLNSTDTVAINKGMDLSADAYLPFNTGIQGNTRPYGSAWDIGADEYYLSVTAPYRKKVIWIR